jgi:hypothetical protein
MSLLDYPNGARKKLDELAREECIGRDSKGQSPLAAGGVSPCPSSTLSAQACPAAGAAWALMSSIIRRAFFSES